MSAMIRRVAAAVLLTLASAAWAQQQSRLPHRVWLSAGVPTADVLAELRSAGIDELAVPVGDAELGETTTRFTMRPMPDLKPLAGWSVTALVWVSGQGKELGDAEQFWTQFAPTLRMLPGKGSLLLVAPQYFEGLPRFAAAVAEESGQSVGLALSAQELAAHLPVGGWPGIELVPVAFGNPQAFGFPPSTIHDDVTALDEIDQRGTPYRPAVVVGWRATPAPGPQPVSLSLITRGNVATYTPGARGDVFALKLPVDWGGTRLDVGQKVEVEVVETARYHRDLGLVLRPTRANLVGWDTVSLPSGEPALGMSREAFLDYLRGGMPFPTPDVELAVNGAFVSVGLRNPSPHASAIATTGNWVELHYSGTEVRDVQLGEFSGVQFGRLEGGVFKEIVARDATLVRLYLPYVAPRSRAGGGAVAFLSAPRTLAVRWGLRLGDGSVVSGPLESRDVRTR